MGGCAVFCGACRIIDILPGEASDQENVFEHGKALADFLLKHFLAYTSNRDFVESIYSDRLIGFALNYSPITNGETSYSKVNIQKFHLPEIEEWETFKTTIVWTKFYHGPLLALHRVAEVVAAYKDIIQGIPNDVLPNDAVKIVIAAAQEVVRILPDLTPPFSKGLNRTNVDDLVNQYTPPVVQWMEEVLDALENMAMDTRTSEPSPRQTCHVLSKIYQLKRKTPPFTAVLALLADKKKQQKVLWGTAAVGGIVVASGGILIVSLPTTIAGAATAMGTGCMSFAKFLEEGETINSITINEKVNQGLETIVYYIALCFMKSNGIINPHSNDDQVNEIVEMLYGRRPTHIAKKQYRAAFLHNLVGKLAKDFREVIAGLRKVGYPSLEGLEWEPQRMITEEESTMSF